MKLEPLDLSEARRALKLAPRRPRAQFFKSAQSGRLTADWAFRVLSSNQTVGLDQQRLVTRSRELAGSDHTMTKFLGAITKNVFGPDGIRLQSKVLLQRGGRPNITANKIIEAAWSEWGKKENCTLDRRTSWVQLQRLIGRTVAVDGECFVRKVRTDSNSFGFALQIINSDRVDRDYGRSSPLVLPSGNTIFMGIESNGQTGAVEAYHIFDRHPSESGPGPRERRRVPASEIIHLFLPIFDNQWRGIPWAAPAMLRMHLLTGYMEAEVVAARVAACQMGVIQKDADPDAEYSGEAEPDGNDSTGGRDIPVQPGIFPALAPGETMTMFDPKHPTNAFSSFVRETKLDIAAGLDAAYMTLTGDLSAANYSSARVGLLDERATWETLQWWFVSELMSPVFIEWLQMAFMTFLRGALPGGQWRAFNVPEWHPRSFDWVDPAKDAEAAISQLQHGMTTLHRICNSRGYSFEETIDEIASEVEYLKSKGLDWLVPMIFSPGNRTAAQAGTQDAAMQDGHAPPNSNQQEQGQQDGTSASLPRFVMLAAERKSR